MLFNSRLACVVERDCYPHRRALGTAGNGEVIAELTADPQAAPARRTWIWSLRTAVQVGDAVTGVAHLAVDAAVGGPQPDTAAAAAVPDRVCGQLAGHDQNPIHHLGRGAEPGRVRGNTRPDRIERGGLEAEIQ